MYDQEKLKIGKAMHLFSGMIKAQICPTSLGHKRAAVAVAGDSSPISTMAANSLRVAAAQMTSINDLAANFATCSRLVKVTYLSSFAFSLLPFGFLLALS